jgi:hypothetical protein
MLLFLQGVVNLGKSTNEIALLPSWMAPEVHSDWRLQGRERGKAEEMKVVTEHAVF